jgi:hypothetical protein
MVHTRETRAAAAEIKFVIAASLAQRVGDWARQHLQADPHGTGAFGDEYETSTLYFDTPEYHVFHRRDSFGRAKYRVRRYGDSPLVFLERKLRKPALLIKRRTMAPIGVVPQLAAPDGTLVHGGEWFHRRLRARQLRPVCLIGYHRTARVADTPDGLVRLTLDCRMWASNADEPRFSPNGTSRFLEDRVVLELKYRHHLPAIFRRLVEEFGLAPQAASKYRFGISALGRARAADSSSRDTTPGVAYA